MMMGCFGGHVAIRTARAIAALSPQHRVLCVCCELCSLHWQLSKKTDNIVACSLFGDCAAAMVIGSQPRAGERSLFEIHKTLAVTVPDSRDMIKWDLTSTGWIVGLSDAIPKAIHQHVGAFVAELLGPSLRPADCTWPLHPGGVAIIDAIEEACGLTKQHTAASRSILYKLGNVSSGTVLCVLDETRRLRPNNEYAVSLSFGPGICIEGCLLKLSNAIRSVE